MCVATFPLTLLLSLDIIIYIIIIVYDNFYYPTIVNNLFNTSEIQVIMQCMEACSAMSLCWGAHAWVCGCEGEGERPTSKDTCRNPLSLAHFYLNFTLILYSTCSIINIYTHLLGAHIHTRNYSPPL